MLTQLPVHVYGDEGDDIERFNMAAELFEGEESEPVDVAASQHGGNINQDLDANMGVGTEISTNVAKERLIYIIAVTNTSAILNENRNPTVYRCRSICKTVVARLLLTTNPIRLSTRMWTGCAISLHTCV